MHNDLIAAQREWGIAFDGAVDLLKPEYKNDYERQDCYGQ